MKKGFRLLSLFLIAFLMFNTIVFAYDAADKVTVYAPDGRAEVIAESAKEAWKAVGWYEVPVTMVYAPDGRAEVIAESAKEAWKAVGWYEVPVTMVYAPDGRAEVIAESAKEAWISVGWYVVPVAKMYAPDGREEIIIESEVEAWENVGWYKAISGDNTYVNENELSSQTEFLIWVSKNEYKLRLYTGSKGKWNLIKEFTCAIGASSTPTCEGTYKYYQAHEIWDYGTYYVGPIMRFNGGYAIHSTLLYKDGTPKDNRVGMKLSHGCVRLQPQDINWLASKIPLNTTVHITA